MGWSILLGLAHQWNAHPVGQSSSLLLPAVTFLFFDEIKHMIVQNFPVELLNKAVASNLKFDDNRHAYTKSNKRSKPN